MRATVHQAARWRSELEPAPALPPVPRELSVASDRADDRVPDRQLQQKATAWRAGEPKLPGWVVDANVFSASRTRPEGDKPPESGDGDEEESVEHDLGMHVKMGRRPGWSCPPQRLSGCNRDR